MAGQVGVTHEPVAAVVPQHAFTADPLPPCAIDTTRTRPSTRAASTATSAVPSVLPSLTTSTSQSLRLPAGIRSRLQS